jgi:hypothetical protein
MATTSASWIPCAFKGTFLSRRKGDIITEVQHQRLLPALPTALSACRITTAVRLADEILTLDQDSLIYRWGKNKPFRMLPNLGRRFSRPVRTKRESLPSRDPATVHGQVFGRERRKRPTYCELVNGNDPQADLVSPWDASHRKPGRVVPEHR